MQTIIYPTIAQVAQCFNVGVNDIDIIGQIDYGFGIMAIIGWLFAICFAIIISAK